MSFSITQRLLLTVLVGFTLCTTVRLAEAHPLVIHLINQIQTSQGAFLASGVKSQYYFDSKGHFNRQRQGRLQKKYWIGSRMLRFGVMFSVEPSDFRNRCALLAYCGFGHTAAFKEGRFLCLSNYIEVNDSTEVTFRMSERNTLTCDKQVQSGPSW